MSSIDDSLSHTPSSLAESQHCSLCGGALIDEALIHEELIYDRPHAGPPIPIRWCPRCKCSAGQSALRAELQIPEPHLPLQASSAQVISRLRRELEPSSLRESGLRELLSGVN